MKRKYIFLTIVFFSFNLSINAMDLLTHEQIVKKLALEEANLALERRYSLSSDSKNDENNNNNEVRPVFNKAKLKRLASEGLLPVGCLDRCNKN